MHPRRRTPLWARRPVQVGILLTPLVLVGGTLAIVRQPEAGPESLQALEADPGDVSEQATTLRRPAVQGETAPAQKARPASPGLDVSASAGLPAFAKRYDGWDAGALRTEADVLEARVKALASARCALQLDSADAAEDVGEVAPGVYVRGEGRRYRLPEGEHADLYALQEESDWLRERSKLMR